MSENARFLFACLFGGLVGGLAGLTLGVEYLGFNRIFMTLVGFLIGGSATWFWIVKHKIPGAFKEAWRAYQGWEPDWERAGYFWKSSFDKS